MKDGAVLMYCKDGVLYPVALTAEQNEILQITARIFAPLNVVMNKPQGKVINLSSKIESEKQKKHSIKEVVSGEVLKKRRKDLNLTIK